MAHLTRHDYAAVLRLLARLEQLGGDGPRWVQAALCGVADLVACERAVVTISDVASGWPLPPARDQPPDTFVASVPLSLEGCRLVRMELRRSHRRFSERDFERLRLLQPHLAYLYRQCQWEPGMRMASAASPGWPMHAIGGSGSLTRREADVMRWLACGKTDRDIAALLAISPRTVHKHLEHIYEKLGVETRTAAVMAVKRGPLGDPVS